MGFGTTSAVIVLSCACGRIGFGEQLPEDATIDAGIDATISIIGCADGEREGFGSTMTFPNIASCAGGWSVPGIRISAPTCARAGGDDGGNPNGTGCSPDNLCAPGWHVCGGLADVEASSATGCLGAAAPLTDQFFATRQSGPGSGVCGVGTNDVFGCGSLGEAPDPSCTPLDRGTADTCSSLSPAWLCDDPLDEANVITKTSPEGGGVLCCHD